MKRNEESERRKNVGLIRFQLKEEKRGQKSNRLRKAKNKNKTKTDIIRNGAVENDKLCEKMIRNPPSGNVYFITSPTVNSLTKIEGNKKNRQFIEEWGALIRSIV